MGLHEYRIVEKMATGSFGVVFKVRRTLDDEVLVMKRIPLQDLDRAERKEAAQEMFLMGTLHHPYIVAQRDAFLFNDNDLCLIMDFYDGGDLALAIAKQRDTDTYFSFDRVMLWFTQMTLALHYLHAHGILHRDMKTHNVFWNARTKAVAVGDFGIAEKIDGEKASAVAAAATWRQQQQHTLLARRGSSSTASFISPASGGPDNRADSPMSRPTPHPARPAEGEAPSAPPKLKPSLSFLTPSSLAAQQGGGHSPMPHVAVAAAAAAAAAADNKAGPAAGWPDANRNGGAGMMKGTPLYMAPEALQGGGDGGSSVGPTSDVWSLGCILYELLCLRHPFESRDIGALVMHVTKGEREPLPPHYPPVVRELVDSMLTLDPHRRPSCSDLLRTPLVAAYVRRLRGLHVPIGGASSAEESALERQMSEFGVARSGDADGAGADGGQRHGGGGDGAAFFSQQVRTPQGPPSVEREAVERRRQEAAQRAAVHLLRSSASARSSTPNAMGGTYSSVGTGVFGEGGASGGSVGTFFMDGGTPRGLLEGEGLHAFYGAKGDDGGGSGGTREALVPPLNPHDSADHSYTAGSSRASSAGASQLRLDRQPSPHFPPSNRSAARDPTGRPPPARRTSASARDEGSGAPGAGVLNASRRLELEGAGTPSQGPARGGRRVSTLSLEELFFREHRSVRDMRGCAIPTLAEEVVRMRLLVELALRERQRVRHAQGYLQHFGGELVATMPMTFRAVAQREDQQRRPVTSPAEMAAVSGPSSSTGRALATAPRRVLAGRLPSSYAHPAASPPQDVREPSRQARVRAAREPQLMAYLKRRELLVQYVLQHISPDALAAVYAYYQSTSVAQRDPRVVMKVVPGRDTWPVLPFIEDVAVLDKYLEGEH